MDAFVGQQALLFDDYTFSVRDILHVFLPAGPNMPEGPNRGCGIVVCDDIVLTPLPERAAYGRKMILKPSLVGLKLSMLDAQK